MKPIVAVTTWKRGIDIFLGLNTPTYTLIDDYAEALEQAGATTLLIARLGDAEAAAVLDRVDGVVVTGGGDIGPHHYGHDNTDSVDIDAAADERDTALVRGARTRGMPLLGICRGHQAVNVALGGTLSQHVLAEGNPSHPMLSDSAEERNAERHIIEIDPDSRLAAVYGTTERKVNSLHHQSVSTVGEGMRAVAWSLDGQIEASESTTDWPVLCVQWHPEMLQEPAALRLFSTFVEDARRYRDR